MLPWVSFVQVLLFCEGKWKLTFVLKLVLQISFPRRPFRRDKSSEPIKTTREFITEIGIALVEVTLELQGFFTLEMHLVL